MSWITRQGAVAHWLYILTQGSVEIRRASITPVACGGQLEAPSFFGEMALLDGSASRPLADVFAVTDAECYRLDKEGFEEDRPRPTRDRGRDDGDARPTLHELLAAREH
ncbi:MAG: cyclic nucleotide-binding domain-containing protein [Polyangiaceae bacterium]